VRLHLDSARAGWHHAFFAFSTLSLALIPMSAVRCPFLRSRFTVHRRARPSARRNAWAIPCLSVADGQGAQPSNRHWQSRVDSWQAQGRADSAVQRPIHRGRASRSGLGDIRPSDGCINGAREGAKARKPGDAGRQLPVDSAWLPRHQATIARNGGQRGGATASTVSGSSQSPPFPVAADGPSPGWHGPRTAGAPRGCMASMGTAVRRAFVGCKRGSKDAAC
jgi:hypothetical protein